MSAQARQESCQKERPFRMQRMAVLRSGVAFQHLGCCVGHIGGVLNPCSRVVGSIAILLSCGRQKSPLDAPLAAEEGDAGLLGVEGLLHVPGVLTLLVLHLLLYLLLEFLLLIL